MSKRRLEKLEGSLYAKEAVRLWLPEAQSHGTLLAYADSLIDQPEAAQPFVALPSQVENAVWDAMRREPRDVSKKVMREAITDTIFLLRLVIDLNVHVEQTLRVERLRHAALYWWSRALDHERQGKPGRDRSDWQRGVATLRGVLLGTERARAAAEGRYLDGRDCLFPALASEWRDLLEAADLQAATGDPDDDSVESAGQQVQRVVYIARADGLEAVGRSADADALARRVAPLVD